MENELGKNIFFKIFSINFKKSLKRVDPSVTIYKVIKILGILSLRIAKKRVRIRPDSLRYKILTKAPRTPLQRIAQNLTIFMKPQR
jgi:hypothetical protein